jgi:hypothetical protein
MTALPRPELSPLRPFSLLRDLTRQVRQLFPLLLALYLPTLLVLLSMFLYWQRTGNDVSKLTQDPIAVVERELLEFQRAPDKSIHTFALLQLPFYTGIVANIGVLFWCAAASLLFFTWGLSRNQAATPYPLAYLLAAALLTSMLLLDDFFLLHERALPRYLGLREEFVLLFYVLAFAAHCLVFHRAILRSDFLLFLLALAFFALALLMDLFPETPQSQFFEDSAKFIGIISWAGYHGRLAWQQVR